MATDHSSRRNPSDNPVVELECAEFRTVAHHALNAIELTVTDPAGNGYRIWIGADVAPAAALRFGAAVVRLIGDDPK